MPTELSVGLVESTPEENQPGIGVVAPFDFALDRELWRWAPDDVSLYLTRLPFFTTPVTVEMAVAIGDRRALRRATRDVLTPQPGVVTFACTSGSFVGGASGEFVLRRTMLEAGAPTVSTTSGALVEALQLLGVRRLAVATPYIDAVTDRLASFLAEHEVETVARQGLGLLGNIWRVTYDEVVEIVRAVDRPDAEALFISCTNLPTYDVIEPLERALGKPVITANQVTMWAALRAIGRDAVGGGTLLRTPHRLSVA
ncbi:Asp/Glu racemase [Pseudonocardia benzenivorans]|jgi:maleate isomerase|uniref:Asp/Glu/hydantoin racemase n=2 Tax=Pseudonocardia TaxID=1847 RepID=F4CME7_PSEUX|nr:Asp/Glu/hydantoin racemase [Pseudonocardia dioxanivorans]AEA23287.1 Asp/Glu/hydantoin racemase [Pseudonocardia dioxanivorans CB1190]GJF03618.1 arylmalonate decarboxylase [Pseudonocardia sp. D17]